MISTQKKSIILPLGGEERKLTFSISTLELYMHETSKGIAKALDTNNPFTRLKILFYCGLIIGKSPLPDDFSIDMAAEWIDDCEDPNLEQAYKFANTAMGFIMSEDEKALTRYIDRAKAAGLNPVEMIKDLAEKQISSN